MPTSNVTQSVKREKDGPSSGYERVLAFLRDGILSGSLRPGDFLLPERELAAALSVSRPMLREALRALSLIGAVEIRHGVGTVVGRPSIGAISEYFTFLLAQQPDAIDDIMESRIAVEHRAIRLACTRATQSDFDQLEEVCQLIEETIASPAEGAQADFKFHYTFVRAARSPSLLGIYNAIEELTIRSHVKRREQILKLGGIQDYLIDHHRLLFAALLDRDAERCDRLLTEHFRIAKDFEHRALREGRRGIRSNTHDDNKGAST